MSADRPVSEEQESAVLDGARILVADDNPELLFTTVSLLEAHGAEVFAAENGAAAVELAEKHLPEQIILDVVMPEKSGLDAARELKGGEKTRNIPILLMSSKDELDDISAGMEAGAEDYLRKPFEPMELIARVRSGLHLSALYRQVSRLEDERLRRDGADGEGTPDGESPFSGAIGESSVFRDLLSSVLRFRDSNAPVLIIGESGTGKERIARGVHRSSQRARGPFVAQNCGALNENLLESSLFGYVKGAFTGAERDTKGLFESADGGTLFLDEVGEMSLPLQAKFLRVLQEGVITPVGSSQERPVDVRIVAATHRDVEEMVAEGTFREDLFFRLKVLQLDVPPLRERGGDIALLARHFLENSCRSQGKPLKSLTEEALLFLERYRWPGNIRELENEIERAVSYSGLATQIGPGYLSQKLWKRSPEGQRSSAPSESATVDRTVDRHEGEQDVDPNEHLSKDLPSQLYLMPLREALAEVESALIRRALQQAKFNKSEAARTLEISRSNLISKVQSYGLEDIFTESE
ncbi:sigma-54 dependent transcriptional regulator [bacterium]|nr:sigma-54 dependent transcriptional regulator [bacterium]